MAAGNRGAASVPPRPAGGHCPASDRTARSAHTAPTTAQPAPSRQETQPAASSWRSAQTPLPPASTVSSPNPIQQSTPPPVYHITAADLCRGSLNPSSPKVRAVNGVIEFVSVSIL